MSYKKATIHQIIAQIDQNRLFLPAIQRKFVWKRAKIELLFDSLMRNYPFGTFLFWQIHQKKAENYVFYEFLKEYDERDPYNRRKTGAFMHPEISGILDGQQRLSSMYIGLMGTHTERIYRARRKNPESYEKACLYLNLLSLPYKIDQNDKIIQLEDTNFEFRFLTADSAEKEIERTITNPDTGLKTTVPAYWMKVGHVLSWDEDPEYDRIIDAFAAGCKDERRKKAIIGGRRILRKALETLFSRTRREELINYFEVSKDDLEEILKIFVRVNSAGTVLDKTDLLFSTIVATWNDGRDKIEQLLKDINAKGDRFDFSNEFLMRCCLILSDGPVLYKVNSFRAENVQKIRDEWERIAEAVKKTVDLLVEFGFNGALLTSNNAVIIIAYYIYKGGALGNGSKDGIKKYLIHALITRIYGNAQEQVLSSLRNYFRTEQVTDSGSRVFIGTRPEFLFDDILNVQLPQQKTLRIREADLDTILQWQKGADAFLVLSLLYPHLRYDEKAFHQDHIHPASGFEYSKLKSMGIPVDDWAHWMKRRDTVPNLQMMEGRQNESKNATPIIEWLGRKTPEERERFMQDNYIPRDVDLATTNFMEFHEKRKELIRKQLSRVLSLSDDAVPVTPDSETEEDEREVIENEET